MPFIEMTDFRLDADCGEQPPSADPKDQLLHETQFRRASVKLAGNPSVRRVVRRIVAVPQVKLRSAHLDLPGAQPDRMARQLAQSAHPFPVPLAQRPARELS